jgi:hypothetical protein
VPTWKVESFLASLPVPADPTGTLRADSSSTSKCLLDTENTSGLLNTAKDLQAEALLYVDDQPLQSEHNAEEAEEDDPDYMNEDAIIQRAVDEAAVEGDDYEEAEADVLPKVPLPDETAPQKADDETDDLTRRLAALSSPPPLPDDPADEDADPRTLSILERLQGLSALQSSPTTNSYLPDDKIPSKFSAPGLSAERDDDIDSWCSKSDVWSSSFMFGPKLMATGRSV